MKTNIFKTVLATACIGLLVVSCNKNDDNPIETPGTDFSGTYLQKDQMGRPAINTVFVSTGMKDAFNVTTPTAMGVAFQPSFQTKLLQLNPQYSTNLLGFTAAQFTGALATDFLTVSTTGTTTFYDGTNVLTGRKLSDDVIDVELILIFGGPDATEKPGLTSDHVNSNDKQFLTSFPYLAAAW